MNYYVLIALSALLLASCASWKEDKATSCVKVEEVPSKLLKQSTSETSDQTTKLSIQLFADKGYSDFEYIKYKISNLDEDEFIGLFNKKGYMELEVPEGEYLIELKSIDQVRLELEGITVSPRLQTQLEIKLGTPSGFMTVQE